ncbi:pinin-like [Mya arenaria]|uniref:pinin-like n=1 Tax=Mya arenaria TaxID=6604 RepID=UPI0022E46645|nr:pinin-like [Mya arenaria]
MATVRGVNLLQSELEKAKEGLRGLDDNIRKLTGRDPDVPRPQGPARRVSVGNTSREFQPRGEGNTRMAENRLFNIARRGIQPGDQRPRPSRGGAFARLGPMRRGRARGQDSGDEEDTRNRPALQSSVVATTPREERSRTVSIEAQNKDSRGQARNRRMFGMILGTLQKFKDESKESKDKEEQRVKIEKKLEEKFLQEKEEIIQERRELFLERRRKQVRIRTIEQKMEMVHNHENWERETKKLQNFILTKAKPCLFYMPKILTEDSESKLEDTKSAVDAMIENRRKKLEEEINEMMSHVGGDKDDEGEDDDDEDDEEEDDGSGEEESGGEEGVKRDGKENREKGAGEGVEEMEGVSVSERELRDKEREQRDRDRRMKEKQREERIRGRHVSKEEVVREDRSGGRGDRSGEREDKSGGRGEKSGEREDRSGRRGDRSGEREDKSGGREDRSGGRGNRSGEREDRSGERIRSKSGEHREKPRERDRRHSRSRSRSKGKHRSGSRDRHRSGRREKRDRHRSEDGSKLRRRSKGEGSGKAEKTSKVWEPMEDEEEEEFVGSKEQDPIKESGDSIQSRMLKIAGIERVPGILGKNDANERGKIGENEKQNMSAEIPRSIKTNSEDEQNFVDSEMSEAVK